MENRTARVRRRLFAMLLALLVPAVLVPSAPALDAERRELGNGLVVLQAERHHLPLVMVALLIKAGAVDEPPARAGLASLTASLLTEGTENRTAKELSREIEFIGASLSASAGHDYTTISLSVLKKDAALGFELLADVLLRPTFDQAELDRVRALTLGALRQREEDPGFLAGRAFRAEVFGRHPYGRLSEGTPEGLEAIRRDDVRNFYVRHYLPNNAILAVVGDLDRKELDGLIRDHLHAWTAGSLPERHLPPVPEPAPARLLIQRELTQANIVLGHVGVARGDPDYYALSVMNYILGGGGFSSRLMESIRDRKGLAYSVYSTFSADREGGDFQAVVQTKNASAPTVIEEILAQMRLMRREGVSKEELADAKAYLVGSFPRRIDTMSKTSRFLALVEFFGLGLDYPESYAAIINAVTEEDVLRVAHRHLFPDAAVLAVAADHKKTGLEETP